MKFECCNGKCYSSPCRTEFLGACYCVCKWVDKTKVKAEDVPVKCLGVFIEDPDIRKKYHDVYPSLIPDLK